MTDHWPPSHGRTPVRRGVPTLAAAALALVGLVLGAGGALVLTGGGGDAAPTPTPTVTATQNVVNVVVPASCQEAIVLGKRAIQGVLDAAADPAARDAALADVQAFGDRGAECQDAAS